MVRLAAMLPPEYSATFDSVQQCGVRYAVGAIDFTPQPDSPPEAQPWSFDSLLAAKTTFEDAGLRLEVIETRPPMHKTKLGLPGRDEEIEVVSELIRNMGALGIPVYCYEWMSGLWVLRTSRTIPTRGGARVSGYDHTYLADLPPTRWGTHDEETLWANLEYFLERVIPVAEEAGVKLAMHPDDPPLSPIRGIARIMSSIEGFQRLIETVPSPANGICLCQGNFTLMTDDLPQVIRHFGEQEKIFFVHFRDVSGTPENFHERFHDDGQTDMRACMEAYRDVGFDGVMRPDHYPHVTADPGDFDRAVVGRCFAFGYIKGLREAVYAQDR